MGTLPGGLKVCGDWSATTGLAQAGRRLALALLRAGIDLTVASYASGAPRIDSLFPDELRALQDGPSRPVSLWTLNVNELHQVSDDELAPGGRPTYDIATWFWELPTLPPWMRRQFTRISELWAPSKFVERTWCLYTDKPVYVVPPVVPIFRADTDNRTLRDGLGLPRRPTIFLASFDFNSTVSRKNPLGVVDAYARAFSEAGNDGPLLVMKAINLERNPDFAGLLLERIEGVGGILIDRQMTAEEFSNLFHACDVYVSLHRSEGFGLGLAESMAIGKPVIGTAYSGNLDYMSADNSCLVGYALREIDASDQTHNPGMEETYVRGELWAEPDLDQAATWMQLLHTDQSLRRDIGTKAAATIRADFSEEAVSRAALLRLKDLYDQLGIDGPVNGSARGG